MPTAAPPCRCSRNLKFDDDNSNSSMKSAAASTSVECACCQQKNNKTAMNTQDNNSGDALSSSPAKRPVCIKCTSIELENSKTKSKLEQLRLVMQQKKERREARKLQLSPYGNRAPATTTNTLATSVIATANNSSTLIAASAAAATDVQTAAAATASGANLNNLVEEVDTAA